MDTYRCYADLARAEREGIDYEKIIRPVTGSNVAVIAPHGGGIEPRTDAIAEAIAGHEFSFYAFRGLKPARNGTLHITSHRFDEPECLELLTRHRWVTAIHGCNEPGERAFLGGLDTELLEDLTRVLRQAGIDALTNDHAYPGTHPDNICNRGKSAKGVQIELTPAFRDSDQIAAVVTAVRSVLDRRQSGIFLPEG